MACLQAVSAIGNAERLVRRKVHTSALFGRYAFSSTMSTSSNTTNATCDELGWDNCEMILQMRATAGGLSFLGCLFVSLSIALFKRYRSLSHVSLALAAIISRANRPQRLVLYLALTGLRIVW